MTRSTPHFTPVATFAALVIAALSLIAESLSAGSVIPPPPNIRVTNYPQLNNEEQCFISPTDTNIVISVWRDFRLGFRQIGIGRSTDGGLTWSDSLIAENMQYLNILTGFATPYYARQSDPTLTVNAAGDFIISVLDYTPNSTTIWDSSTVSFYRSTDKGATWTGPFPKTTSFGPYFEDKQFITADRTGGPHDGNVYISWARFPNPTRMMFQRSIDGGVTFGDTVIVGPAQTSSGCGGSQIDAGQFPAPLVNSDGSVHVFWNGVSLDSGGICTGVYAMKHAVSVDGGVTFGAEDVVTPVSGWTSAAGGINTYSQPAVDADISGGPFDGRIYLAFTNIGPEDAGRSDVDLMVSTDNGLSWSPRMRVNDFVNSDLTDSFHPWTIVNQDGVVAVLFYDNRLDPPFYTKFDLFAAYSYDGGATITTDHRITTLSSDPGFLASAHERRPPVEYRDGVDDPDVARLMTPQAGLIGEYIGLSVQWDKANATWTDSRHFNSEVYTANWYLPLLEPRLIEPPDQALTQAPALRWATSWKNHDDAYRVEVAPDGSFGSLAFSASTDTNFADPGALADGEYFWRAKAFKISTDDSSEYSPTFSFTVDNTPPSAPNLLSPPDGAVVLGDSPTYDWEDATDALGAVSYELQVSTDPAFTPGPATTGYPGLSMSHYSLAAPLPEYTPVYWRVITSDEAGNTSTTGAFQVTYSPNCCNTPGDADNSGSFNIGDVTFSIARIFSSGPPAPCCPEMDADGNGSFNIGDVTYGIAHIFSSGPAPVCGPPEAGC
ncbi:MAG TPA: hypothetical protein VLB27_11470 [candidate division Zixibacteria bacterium]|nr:hypothetical protein [candidate division Zixibacteria bacterium]